MFYNFWQLKVTVFVLCLALSLGQELLPTCERDYCYERLIERRSVDGDYFREWNRGEGFHGTELIKEEHLGNAIRKVNENRVKILDFKSRGHVSRSENPENRRELNFINSNRKELTDRKSNLIRSENRVLIDDISALANEDRRSSFDEIRRIERFAERTIERQQNPVEKEREDRLVTTRRLNERDNQQDKNQEFLRLIDRRKNLAEISDSESSGFVSRRENRVIRHQVDNLILNRRELREDNNAIVEEGRRREMSEMNLLTVDRRNNYQDVDRRSDEIRRTTRLNERTFERKQIPVENEREDSLVTTKRLNERQNQQDENRDRLSQLSHVDRLNERDENTKRLRQRLSNEFRIPNERISENKRRLEHSIRDEHQRLNERKPQLDEREQLNENHRCSERHSEENRQDNDKLGRNREARRFTETERLSDKRENLRRLYERENQKFDQRFSLKLNEDFSESEEERQIRDQRENLRQSNNQDNRYDISRRFNERAQRQNESKRERVDNRAWISKHDFETRQRELKDRREIIKANRPEKRLGISSELNSRVERESDNLRERENVLNRSYKSQRLNSRLEDSEDEALQNSDEYQRERVNRRISEHGNYKEQRNIREQLNENRESRSIGERLDILVYENIGLRKLESEDETLQSLNQVQREYSRRIIRDHENYRGQRDIRERLGENQEFRNTNERRDILLDMDIELSEKRHENIRELNDHRSNNREGHLNHSNNYRHRNKNKQEHYQRYRLIRNEDTLNMIDEYKQKPILSLNKGYMAFGQSALLAYVIIKTLNSKNDIKYNLYQNLQETVGLMWF